MSEAPACDPSHAARNATRVKLAREAMEHGVALFADANGTCTRKQALTMAERFAQQHATWFQEPVPSDDPDGLRLLRDCAPAGMDVSAGEYGHALLHFRRLLGARAVDMLLQADATRCGGLTGFMRAAAPAEALRLPQSSHCAPALDVAACCCSGAAVRLEWLHDHQRIERQLFRRRAKAGGGHPRAHLQRTELGLDLKECYAEECAL